MGRPRGLSDNRLQRLWRQAVLRVWLYDPFTGEGDHERLECHHVVLRRFWFTRHDWRNGIPLSRESHLKVHAYGGQRLIDRVLTPAHREYLDRAAVVRKEEYLPRVGMSDVEFLTMRKRELERVIEEGASVKDARNFEGLVL